MSSYIPEDMERRRLDGLRIWLSKHPNHQMAPLVVQQLNSKTQSSEQEGTDGQPGQPGSTKSQANSEKLSKKLCSGEQQNAKQKRKLQSADAEVPADVPANPRRSLNPMSFPTQIANKWDRESSLELLAEMTRFQVVNEEVRDTPEGQMIIRAPVRWTLIAEKLPNRSCLEFSRYASSCRVHFMNLGRVYMGKRKGSGPCGRLDPVVDRALHEYLQKYARRTRPAKSKADSRGFEGGESEDNLTSRTSFKIDAKKTSMDTVGKAGGEEPLSEKLKGARRSSSDSPGEKTAKISDENFRIRSRNERTCSEDRITEDGLAELARVCSKFSKDIAHEEGNKDAHKERMQQDNDTTNMKRVKTRWDKVSSIEAHKERMQQGNDTRNMKRVKSGWDKASSIELLVALKNMKEFKNARAQDFNKWESVVSQLPNGCNLDLKTYILSCKLQFAELMRLYEESPTVLDGELRNHLDKLCQECRISFDNLHNAKEVPLVAETSTAGSERERFQLPSCQIEKNSVNIKTNHDVMKSGTATKQTGGIPYESRGSKSSGEDESVHLEESREVQLEKLKASLRLKLNAMKGNPKKTLNATKGKPMKTLPDSPRALVKSITELDNSQDRKKSKLDDPDQIIKITDSPSSWDDSPPQSEDDQRAIRKSRDLKKKWRARNRMPEQHNFPTTGPGKIAFSRQHELLADTSQIEQADHEIGNSCKRLNDTIADRKSKDVLNSRKGVKLDIQTVDDFEGSYDGSMESESDDAMMEVGGPRRGPKKRSCRYVIRKQAKTPWMRTFETS